MTLIGVADHGNIYLLAQAFAASSTFQSVLGVSTTADAFERVHYPDVEFDDDGGMYCEMNPPRIIIADELGEDELTEGGIHSFRRSESFWCSFDFYIPPDITIHGKKNSWAWFTSKVLAVLKEARDLGKTGNVGSTGKSYPVISSARRVEGPYRIDVSERDLDDTKDSPELGGPNELWHVAWEVVRGY